MPFENIKKGALHRQLHIPQDERIPTGTLRDIVQSPVGGHIDHTPVTAKLKKRANFALNARKWR